MWQSRLNYYRWSPLLHSNVDKDGDVIMIDARTNKPLH